MKLHLITFILLNVSSCSTNIGDKKRISFSDFKFVRVYGKSSSWEPEKNCRFVSYEKVAGGQIQSNHDGYEEAIEELREHVHKIGGTVAKVKDFTESFMWANVYFCSPKYDKFSPKSQNVK